MALTPEGAKLTELHRLLQVKLSAQSMAATRLLWSSLDPAKGASAREAWLRQQVKLSGVFDGKSAAAAAAYVKNFREAEGFPGGPIVAVRGFDEDWARESMSYNGSNKVQALMDQGVSPKAAMAQVAPTAMAAAQRLSLGGGRRVIDESALANPRSTGWRRVSDGSACTFCAMLVSRGPAYKTQESAGEGRHWHKKCGCTAEEVFGEWIPNAREKEYEDQYVAAVKELKAEGRVPGTANVLEKMRLNGKFNDSPKPAVKSKAPEIDVESIKIAPPKAAAAVAPKPAGSRPYELKRPAPDPDAKEWVESMPAEWQERFAQRQKDRVDAVVGQPVKVTMTDTGLKGFLRDGEMKTLHDVDSSFGDTGNTIEQRASYENGIMGAPEGAKPIYGWSQTSPRMVDNYGDFHIIMKPEVSKRTTVTFGDSLSGLRPVWMDELPTVSAHELAAATGPLRLNDPPKPTRSKKPQPPPDLWREVRYAETQIHGGIRLDDVDSLAMSASAQRRLTKEQMNILSERGISVKIIKSADEL